MSRIIIVFILFIGFVSCKSSKKAKNNTSTKVIIDKRTDNKTKQIISSGYNTSTRAHSNSEIAGKNASISTNIIDYAKQFEGVKYKWGGTTKAGMDCSGLVFESFKAYDIFLPRISRDMAKRGKKITLKQTLRGDLLFFKTRNRRNDINHVGLVTEIKDNTIYFIHSTTSAGVIISSLNESYWKNAFHEVRRIL
ncbi:hypothetical protein APS56_08540 [Pseudalgibacter alginicilyticus]|uniref:NlpC/P60 domain-containing protein n=1 Tax=Pseudalgibacter alginicilyticus TaxID=1736674 RepID=A0A0P0D4S6_9FLAO|nr:C40 family peptidase [Pseudalgibacter alginicilyticus]ALJ05168.1 hypothetical protein APS56_08540 [Pseudalgibacter alginicilyticus]